jgi:hypothetical protein
MRKDPQEELPYILHGVSLEELDTYLEEVRGDLMREDSAVYRRAIESGIAATPAQLRDIASDIGIKPEGMGISADLVDIAVVVAGSEAVRRVAQDLWKHVFLPAIKRKFGGDALKESRQSNKKSAAGSKSTANSNSGKPRTKRPKKRR